MQSGFGTNQWSVQTGVTINELKSKAAAHTDAVMPIYRIRAITPFVFPGKGGGHPNHFRIFGFHINLATVAAIIARRGCFFELPGFIGIFREFIGDGSNRTHRQAIAAEFTIQRLIAFRHDLGKPALFHKLQGIDA